MSEGNDQDAAFRAAGLAALSSVEGFTLAELIDHVYDPHSERSEEIERIRETSPAMGATLRGIEAERLARSEAQAQERDRKLNEIVLASLVGPDALRKLIVPESEPWFVAAVEKALARFEAATSRDFLQVELGGLSDAPPKSPRKATWVRAGLALAATLVVGALVWSAKRHPNPNEIAQDDGPKPITAPKSPRVEKPVVVHREPMHKSDPTPLRRKPPKANIVFRKKPTPLTKRGTEVAMVSKPHPGFPSVVADQIALYRTLPAVIIFRGATGVHTAVLKPISPDPGNASFDSLNPRFVWPASPAGVEAKLVRVGAGGTVLDTVPLKSSPDGRGQTPAAPLTPGAVYRLTLAPPVDPQAVELPEESRYVFRTLSNEERMTVAWADRNVRRFPKESAMVYFQAGLYADAHRAAQAAPKGAFTDPKAQAWRERFAAALKTRQGDPSRTDLP